MGSWRSGGSVGSGKSVGSWRSGGSVGMAGILGRWGFSSEFAPEKPTAKDTTSNTAPATPAIFRIRTCELSEESSVLAMSFWSIARLLPGTGDIHAPLPLWRWSPRRATRLLDGCPHPKILPPPITLGHVPGDPTSHRRVSCSSVDGDAEDHSSIVKFSDLPVASPLIVRVGLKTSVPPLKSAGTSKAAVASVFGKQ